MVIRFGHDWDPQCMVMDETLYKIAEKVKNFAVIYLVDISEVPDFNKMYEIYDPCTVMFFFRNKHMMIDLGTGNNNKVNWPVEDQQEMIDLIEVVFQGARKGRGLVISPKDYSTKYKVGLRGAEAAFYCSDFQTGHSTRHKDLAPFVARFLELSHIPFRNFM